MPTRPKAGPTRRPEKAGKWRPRKKAPTASPEARLQKILAASGIASRRKAEEMIREGRVTVNRTRAEIGTKADPLRDTIEVDGVRIRPRAGALAYVLLNKPRGYISSVSDPLGRPVVMDLVKKSKLRLFPVGRLDYDAEGALLLTNDGELANRLIHPSCGVAKKYLVKVRDVPSAEDLKTLERGVRLEDGVTLPARSRLIRRTKENSWIELTVVEGRNRLIKRMCMAVGHPVAKLNRVEFAGLRLAGLKPGESRPLTAEEVERLRRL